MSNSVFGDKLHEIIRDMICREIDTVFDSIEEIEDSIEKLETRLNRNILKWNPNFKNKKEEEKV